MDFLAASHLLIAQSSISRLAGPRPLGTMCIPSLSRKEIRPGSSAFQKTSNQD